MNATVTDLYQRLAELEGRRQSLEREILSLRRMIEERGDSNITHLDRWSVSGAPDAGAPRRSPTQPYLHGRDVPLASREHTGSLPLGVGAPLMSDAPQPEELAAFDAGQLRGLSDAELDDLPYGLVIVDVEGNVLRYNDTESRMVGLPAERVVGLNFFRDIAPCTRVRAFEGRFREFAKSARSYSVETFDFVFRFQRETQYVTIYLTPGRTRGTVNISMLRRKREPR